MLALSLGEMGRQLSKPFGAPLKFVAPSSASPDPRPRGYPRGSPAARSLARPPSSSPQGTASQAPPEAQPAAPAAGPRPGGDVPGSRAGPAVPRLRSGRGAGAGLAGEAQDAREPMGTLGGAGLAAAAGGPRTLGMEGEGRASRARSSGLPAGGAGGDCPGGAAPLPGSSGSSALLPAEVLDLDEDEDDLEVFSKVRAAAAAARPGKVPRQLRELAPRSGGRPCGLGGGRGWICPRHRRRTPPGGSLYPGLRPGGSRTAAAPGWLCTLTFCSAGPWLRGVCKVVIFSPAPFLLFPSLTRTFLGTVAEAGRRGPASAPVPGRFNSGNEITQVWRNDS